MSAMLIAATTARHGAIVATLRWRVADGISPAYALRDACFRCALMLFFAALRAARYGAHAVTRLFRQMARVMMR